ncbi:MAG TPA: glutamate--tRNA ligase [Solirubrobacteraceae bacterium]|jgi:glutamyl-tRNA synthetase|nr:glutamate--tRNA ligase [Solirubrobacteraceae bacterium]
MDSLADQPERPMRVRFAPSPTGALHIGGARTALFNWLLARHHGGELVLRIEDTDRERSTPENVEQILDALRWLELDWDEGPILQTERSERHAQALRALLDGGYAYRSNATAEDVKAYKLAHGAERGFRGEPEAEGAIRLRVSDEGATVVHDAVRGDTRFEHVHLDDPVIARADGSTLYNFAVAIDDLDARITHVVRGEDHLSNTPKQLLVLEAARAAGLGPQTPPMIITPLYAHLPLLHGPDGRKLSKRHGAASVQELRDAGYLPEAVRNYLALLGWGAGDGQTVLSTDELIARFGLDRVSRNPARFDETKLRWLNGVWIRELPVGGLAARIATFLCDGGHAAAAEDDRLARAVQISQEKIHTLADFWPLTGPLLEEPVDDPKARERWLGEEGTATLRRARETLVALDGFSEAEVGSALQALVARLQAKPREVYQPVRVAIAGSTVSPGIFESVALLGREETLRRIDNALEIS